MRRYILCYIVMFLWAAVKVGAQSINAQDGYSDRARQYVQQYAALAIEEQRKNGIPAAVTLGQGILETEAGISELMVNANNHFGIKCKNNWQGETYTYTDDAPDECFKKYKCASDSYRDHSEHLKRNPRYSPLFSLKTTDYKGWAVCLKKCGYATNPQYATRLIQIIEDFGLEQYTLSALDSSLLNNTAPVAANGSDYKLYAASYTTPVKDTPVKKIAAKDTAKRPGTSVHKEGSAQATAPAPQQPRIIISHDRHTVKEGETVASIARMEGVDQRQLMEFNFLYPNEEPVPGTILELQKQANHKPVVWINSMPAHKENAIVGTDDKAAGRNDDYITIDRSKPAAAPQAVAASPRPISESTPGTIIIPVQPAGNNAAAKPATPRPSRLHVNRPAPAVASEESDPQRDQQLASMKAELDKVVYADDSKLMASNTPPAPTAITAPARPEPKASTAKETRLYTVRKGDTAFSIAKKNNITVEQLMQWNNMQSGTVKVGQNLKVKE